MERHSETLGNALQLLYRDILASTADGIQIGTLHPQYVCQLLLTHVFSLNAFLRPIVVVVFIALLVFKWVYKNIWICDYSLKKTDAAHVAPVHVSWHTKRKTTNVYYDLPYY